VKPSELAKQLGFRSLNELCNWIDVTPRTLVNWSVSNPDRYIAVCLGASQMRQEKIIRDIQQSIKTV